MTLIKKTLQYLIKKLLNSFKTKYLDQYQKALPIILVTGTTGKSSMTLILNQYFEDLDYKVYSGTSLNRNLNSLAGLGMILSNTTFNLEDGKLLHKISASFRLVFNLLNKIIWQNFEIKPNTILIYEIGYDHQNESQIFEDFFGEIEVLVCTNLAWEHNQGFEDNFEMDKIASLEKYLPKKLVQAFDDSQINPKLKNIAFEQLTLAPNAKLVITPVSIGSIDNRITSKTNSELQLDTESIAEPHRNQNFNLETTNYQFNPNYFLPDTFAKNATILELVAKQLEVFNQEKVNQTLYNVHLPQGRFGKFQGINNTTIIDSAYNSDPVSASLFLKNVEQTIEFYKDISNREAAGILDQPKHTLILGEMRELGDSAIIHHQNILEQLSGLLNKYPYYIEDTILIGDEWLKCDQDILPKIEEDVNYIRNQDQVWKVFNRAGDINSYLNDRIRPNSWFWVKGSQNTIFLEIVVEHLLADKNNVQYLCRRGPVWDKVREWYR